MDSPYSRCEDIQKKLNSCYSKEDCNKKLIKYIGWSNYCKQIKHPLKEKDLTKTTKCGTGFSKQ